MTTQDAQDGKRGREPVCWALLNPATGKVDHRCYQREDAAIAGAANQSNRWRRFVAIPLFREIEP